MGKRKILTDKLTDIGGTGSTTIRNVRHVSVRAFNLA